MNESKKMKLLESRTMRQMDAEFEAIAERDFVVAKKRIAELQTERIKNILSGEMTPEDYHRLSNSKFAIEQQIKALEELLAFSMAFVNDGKAYYSESAIRRRIKQLRKGGE